MTKTAARKIGLNTLPMQPRFSYGEMAQVAEVTGAADGTRLGTGIVRMTRAEIPWTVQYDEVVLVLEGRLTVRTEAGDWQASKMECLWPPKGTALTYLAESALVFYAIEPANWAEEGQP
jgi:ethanolamine utilization protein EutQ